MSPRRPLGSLTAAVDELSAILRRRREDRARRVRIYDEQGHARALDPAGEEAAPLVDAAAAMIAAAAASGAGRAESGAAPPGDAED